MAKTCRSSAMSVRILVVLSQTILLQIKTSPNMAIDRQCKFLVARYRLLCKTIKHPHKLLITSPDSPHVKLYND